MMQPISKIMEVTVEKSFDVVEKSWEERVFLKLFITLRSSGLLARLSDKDFRTLVAIATFMDADGRCYPSQKALAKALGITQPGAAKRVKSLLSFRWKNKALIRVKKTRGEGGKYQNTHYTILPCTGLKIFDKDSHMPPGHMAGRHTNKIYNGNKNNNVRGKPRTRPRMKGGVKPDPLALRLAHDMDDAKSLPYYRKLVERDGIDPYILLKARGEVLEEKKIRKSKGAMFAFLVKKALSALKAPP
jgi:hypothetical protein